MDAGTFWIQEDGSSGRVLKLDMQVDDEATLLSANEELLLLLEEQNNLHHANWHLLLVNYIQMLIEHN